LRAQREEDNGFIRRAQLLLQFSDCGVVLQGDLQHFRGMRLCKLLQLPLLLSLMLVAAVVSLWKLLVLFTLAELRHDLFALRKVARCGQLSGIDDINQSTFPV
jgi:hypothetical protein